MFSRSLFKKISSHIWSQGYFFYFSFVGLFLAYFPLWLQDAGYSESMIGTIMSIFILTRIIAPTFWSYWADTRAYHVPLLRLMSLLSLICGIVLLLNTKQYFWLIVTTISFGFVWNGLLPIYEASSTEQFQGDNHRYNQSRLWGSVGFIIAIVSLGLIDDYLPSIKVYSFAIGLMLCLFCVCFTFYRLPNIQFTIDHQLKGSVLQFFKERLILSFLLITILMHMSHGLFYSFFTLHLKSYHYSNTVISFFWIVGVIAEIFVFIYIRQWLYYWSAYRILVLCLASAIIRWLALGYYAGVPVIVFVAQLLHAFTFGAFHVLTMRFIRTYFAGQYQARAQSIFAMLSYGMGAALGTYMGGYVIQHFGAGDAFLLSALQVSVALLIALFILPHKGDRAFV